MKLDYPATGRNAAFIQAVLEKHLPPSGLVLEVASGSGQHVLRFAEAFPHLRWQPSDPEERARRSVNAYRADAGLENLEPAVYLDASTEDWPVEAVDAVLCINMIHISPWSATEGLVSGVKRRLNDGGVLFLYGPYKRDGAHTAPSNEAFDRSLQSRDPSWGVRDVEAIVELAAPQLELTEIVEMPANNLSVVFKRR